jgi:hypothetical protein
MIHPDRADKPMVEHDEVGAIHADNDEPLGEHHELVIAAPATLTPKLALETPIEAVPAPTPAPVVVQPAEPTGPVIPKLEPGEVYVDELGNVHQGE